MQKRSMNSNGHAMMVALVISATREPLRGATEFCHWDFKALKKRSQIVKRTGLSAALLLVGYPIWGCRPRTAKQSHSFRYWPTRRASCFSPPMRLASISA